MPEFCSEHHIHTEKISQIPPKPTPKSICWNIMTSCKFDSNLPKQVWFKHAKICHMDRPGQIIASSWSPQDPTWYHTVTWPGCALWYWGSLVWGEEEEAVKWLIHVICSFFCSFFPSFFENLNVRISCMGRIGIYTYNTWQCKKILDYVNYCGTIYFHFIPLGKYITQVTNHFDNAATWRISSARTLLCNELHTEWHGKQYETGKISWSNWWYSAAKWVSL